MRRNDVTRAGRPRPRLPQEGAAHPAVSLRHLEGARAHTPRHVSTHTHTAEHACTHTSRQTHTHLRWLTRCTDLPAPHVSEFAAESSVMVGGKPTAAGDQVLGSRDGSEVSCPLELQAGWACSPSPSCRPPLQTHRDVSQKTSPPTERGHTRKYVQTPNKCTGVLP